MAIERSALAGQRLREVREHRGQSQLMLALKLGVTRGTIQNYEHGRAYISDARRAQLAHALECDPSDLLQAPGSTLPKYRFAPRRLLPSQHDNLNLWPFALGFYGRDVGEITIIHLDPVALMTCGLAPDAPGHLDWTLSDWFKRIHADDHARIQKELERLQSGGAFATQYRLTGWDGVERSIVDCSRIIFDALGRVTRLQGMLFEVTHVRRTQAAEQSIARFVRIIRQT